MGGGVELKERSFVCLLHFLCTDYLQDWKQLEIEKNSFFFCKPKFGRFDTMQTEKKIFIKKTRNAEDVSKSFFFF